jgi:hypothetical protein
MKYIKKYESINEEDVDLKEVSEELGKELKRELTLKELKILSDFLRMTPFNEPGKKTVLEFLKMTKGELLLQMLKFLLIN